MLTAPKASFAEALRQADSAYRDQGVPNTVAQRLRTRLDVHNEGAPTRRWLAMGVGLAATTCAAALVFFALQGDHKATKAPSPAVAGGFSLEQSSADLQYKTTEDGSLIISSGECEATNRSLGITLKNTGSIIVKNQKDGVRLVRGTAHFSIEERGPNQAPARVWVSHGRIEVLGTKFTIRQRQDGGDVVLHEGSIRFVGNDKQVRHLAPGDLLTWPIPQESKPALTNPPIKIQPPLQSPTKQRVVRITPQPKTTVSNKEADPAKPALKKRDTTIDELAKLRSRGEYGNAVRLLRKRLTIGGLSSAAREQLSYELGAILTHQLKNRVAACDHWKLHSRQYPAGRYTTEVRSAKSRLGCVGGKQ